MPKFVKIILIILGVLFLIFALVIAGLFMLGKSFLDGFQSEQQANSCYKLEMVLEGNPKNYTPEIFAEVVNEVAANDSDRVTNLVRQSNGSEFTYASFDEKSSIKTEVGKNKIIVQNTKPYGFYSEYENRIGKEMAGSMAGAFELEGGYDKNGTQAVADVLVAIGSKKPYSTSQAGWKVDFTAVCK